MRLRFALLAVTALLVGPFANAGDDYDLTQPLIDDNLTAMGESVMLADLEPLAGVKGATGALLQKVWFDHAREYHETFRVDVIIPIPSAALGINSLEDAIDSDVRVSINRHGYMVECMLALEPIVARSYVAFAVELRAIGDRENVKPLSGICDLDWFQDGVQMGMPVLEHGDYINSFVMLKPAGEYEFLGGYCP